MYLSTYLSESLARDRHRGHLQRAQQARLARQAAGFRRLERARRRAQRRLRRAERRLHRAWQRADELRATIRTAG